MREVNHYFLNEVLALEAITSAVNTVFAHLPVKRRDVHVVILTRCLLKDESAPAHSFPKNYSLGTKLLCEKSFGDVAKWEHDYKDIAQIGRAHV